MPMLLLFFFKEGTSWLTLHAEAIMSIQSALSDIWAKSILKAASKRQKIAQ